MAKADTLEVTTGANEVATAVATALAEIDNSANIVEQCVASAMELYDGLEVPPQDLTYITDRVATIRKWSGSSLKVRKSEVRAIVRAYFELPDAMARYRKKCATFTWHEAVDLARALANNNWSIPSAVAQCLSKNKKKKQSNADPLKAFRRHVRAIQDIRTTRRNIIAFRKDLAALLKKHKLSESS